MWRPSQEALTTREVDVNKFNALPRPSVLEGSTLSNRWHFDVRFIQIEPTPMHMLFIVHPESQFVHSEPLPMNTRAGSDGYAWFPETSAEAAPEVAKSLLHCFIQGWLKTPENLEKGDGPYFAPWSLSTDENGLAVAVRKEFKRLKVMESVCANIEVSPSTMPWADSAFADFLDGVKRGLGIPPMQSRLLTYGEALTFDYRVEEFPEVMRLAVMIPGEMGPKLAYAQQLSYCTPDSHISPVPKQGDIPKALALFERKSFASVKAEVDQGDLPDSILDYALRLLFGIGGSRNRKLARQYLIKVTLHSNASISLKATAHAFLIGWYQDTFLGNIRVRYLFMCCHHACEALRLLKNSNLGPAQAVVSFTHYVFDDLAYTTRSELLFLYPELVNLKSRVEAFQKKGSQQEKRKRLEKADRSRCANVGCKHRAEHGNTFKSCSGKCDRDKKPAYCSVECQKSDWKIHKPYCKPGMECSVIDEP